MSIPVKKIVPISTEHSPQGRGSAGEIVSLRELLESTLKEQFNLELAKASGLSVEDRAALLPLVEKPTLSSFDVVGALRNKT